MTTVKRSVFESPDNGLEANVADYGGDIQAALSAGDYIELEVTQSSGGNLDVLQSVETYLSIAEILD